MKMDARVSAEPAVSGTQTIQRAAQLLRLLTANNRTGMRLADLHRSAALERSTTHRILQGLIAEHLVVQHPVTKRYFLGNALYEMGLAAAPRFQLRDVCHSHIKALAEKTGDTVFLVIRSGFDGVCVDRMEGSFPIRVFVLEVGRHRPLNVGGCSIAIMSTLPDEEIRRISMVNREKIARSYPNYSEQVFWQKIEETRAKGYLVNEVLEVPNVRAIAVPIRDAYGGAAIAAISISAVASRIEAARIGELSALLFETVQRIETDIADLQAG
jgi:DNA-binding IclR family transcriptional regulator